MIMQTSSSSKSLMVYGYGRRFLTLIMAALFLVIRAKRDSSERVRMEKKVFQALKHAPGPFEGEQN